MRLQREITREDIMSKEKIPKNAGKAPSFQFYVDDWLSDPELRSCSIEARGFFIDLMCYMHKSVVYGELLINGRIPDDKQLIKLLRVNHKTYYKLLKGLIAAGVLKQDGEGVLYNGRMMKDYALREKSKEDGKLGGNPNLLGRGVNQGVKPDDTQNPTPSSSTSSSTSISTSLYESSDEYRLGKTLFDLIKARDEDRKEPDFQVEAQDIHRLIEDDHRSPEEIEKTIQWCQQDKFWRTRITSAAKLREHYDNINLRMIDGEQVEITSQGNEYVGKGYDISFQNRVWDACTHIRSDRDAEEKKGIAKLKLMLPGLSDDQFDHIIAQVKALENDPSDYRPILKQFICSFISQNTR
jgi:hypothetical protein